jgi:Lhr-like helicase
MTVVQKYYQEENKNLVHDQDDIDEYKEIADRLGMGEIKVTKSNPVPFEPLTSNMESVVSELCPSEDDYREYTSGTIPLDILRLIDLCEREKYFKRITVHFDREHPDPFVIGEIGYWEESSWYNDSRKSLKDQKFETEQAVRDAKGKHPNFSSEGKFLIAKWGDVEKSMDELKRMAVEKFISTRKAENENKILELRMEIEKSENEAKLRFGVL